MCWNHTQLAYYYYRARYYDPGTGRFLSEDPIGFKAADANLYRYVKNWPMIAVDPYGKYFIYVAVIVIGTVDLVYDLFNGITDDDSTINWNEPENYDPGKNQKLEDNWIKNKNEQNLEDKWKTQDPELRNKIEKNGCQVA